MNQNFTERQNQERIDFEEKQRLEKIAFEAKQKAAAEREVRRQEERNKYENYRNSKIDMLIDDYGFNKDVAEKIFYKAWDEGHSCGYNEVDWHLEDLADFVDEVMRLQYEKNKN